MNKHDIGNRGWYPILVTQNKGYKTSDSYDLTRTNTNFNGLLIPRAFKRTILKSYSSN